MADEQKTVEYNLKYTTDQSSLNTTIQGTNRLAQSIETIPNSLGKLSVASQNNLTRLQQHIESSQGKVRQFDASIEDLRTGLLSLESAAETGLTGLSQGFQEAEAAAREYGETVENLPPLPFDDTPASRTSGGGAPRTGGGDSGGRSSNLQRIDQTGRIGTQILGGLGQSELGNAVSLVGDLAGGIDDLGLKSALTLGGIGLLGAGLTAALSAIQQQVAAYEHEYDVRLKIIEAIKEQTTAEANSTIEASQTQKENAQANIDYLTGLRDVQVGLLNTLNIQQWLEAEEKITALNNTIAEQQRIVDEAEITIGFYNSALAEGATAANDLLLGVNLLTDALGTGKDATREVTSIVDDFWHRFAESAREGVEEQGRGVVGRATDAGGDTSERAQLLNGTAEAARNRQQALQDDIAATRASIAVLEESGDTSRAVQAEIDRLNAVLVEDAQDLNALVTEYLPVLDAREREATGLRNLLGGIESAGSGLIDGIQGFIQVSNESISEVASATDTLTTSLQRLSAARDTRLGELASKLQSDLASLGQEFFSAREDDQEEGLEQLASFHAREEQRAQEHQTNLARITRDGQQAVGDAAADGNIRGALEAERNLNNQLEDAKDNFDLQSDARAQELDELEDSISDQARERRQDYTQKYNDLIQSNQREVAATHAKYQADVALQQSAYQAQITNLQASLLTEAGIRASANAAVLNDTVSWATGMASIGQGLLNSLAGSSASTSTTTNANTGSSGLTATPFATGGVASGLSRVDDDVFNRMESGLTRSGKLLFFGEQTQVLDGNRTQRLLAGDTSALPGGAAARRGGDDNSVSVNVGNITVTGANDPQATANAVRREILTKIGTAMRQQAQTRRAARQGRQTA
jgi:hypothetical protein